MVGQHGVSSLRLGAVCAVFIAAVLIPMQGSISSASDRMQPVVEPSEARPALAVVRQGTLHPSVTPDPERDISAE